MAKKKRKITVGTAMSLVSTGKAGMRMLTGKKKYKVKQDLLNLTGDYHITDDKDKAVFLVDAALISVRKSLVFKDAKGNEVCSIKEPMMTAADDLTIQDADGKPVATARRKGRNETKYSVTFRRGPEIEVDGDVPGKDYKIRIEDETVADVNKGVFTMADSYGVEVDHGEDDALVLAAVVALDILSSEGKGVSGMIQGTVSSSVEGIAMQGAKAALKGATRK
jgi:uncharacterized protein YxjI